MVVLVTVAGEAAVHVNTQLITHIPLQARVDLLMKEQILEGKEFEGYRIKIVYIKSSSHYLLAKKVQAVSYSSPNNIPLKTKTTILHQIYTSYFVQWVSTMFLQMVR